LIQFSIPIYSEVCNFYLNRIPSNQYIISHMGLQGYAIVRSKKRETYRKIKRQRLHVLLIFLLFHRTIFRRKSIERSYQRNDRIIEFTFSRRLQSPPILPLLNLVGFRCGVSRVSSMSNSRNRFVKYRSRSMSLAARTIDDSPTRRSWP